MKKLKLSQTGLRTSVNICAEVLSLFLKWDGIRSGLRLIQVDTWICIYLNLSIVALNVCLGSLYSLEVVLCPSFKSFVAPCRCFFVLFFRIAVYLPSSIFPSALYKFSIPAEGNNQHSMMLPPPKAATRQQKPRQNLCYNRIFRL